MLRAIGTAGRWKNSFWDAMIVRAAMQAGAAGLWSEDLNHGPTYDGVIVRHPFSA